MTSLYRGAGFLLGAQLRATAGWTILVWSVGLAVGFIKAPEIFAFLIAPADGRLSPFNGLPVYSSPTGMFGATIGLSFLVGTLAALPVVVAGTLKALKVLLPFQVWKRVVFFTTLVVCLLVIGAAFNYYVIMPVSLKFFLSFGKEVATPVINLNEYMDMLLSLSMWMSLIFTYPVWSYLLSKGRVVSYQRIKGYRKYAPFVLTFFATIISPGLDGFITFLVAAPMIALYEIGLFTAWWANRSDGNYFKDLGAQLWVVIYALLWMVWLWVTSPVKSVWGIIKRTFRRLMWWR